MPFHRVLRGRGPDAGSEGSSAADEVPLDIRHHAASARRPGAGDSGSAVTRSPMSAPSTTMGPVEWIAIAFPGPRLADALAPALAELVRSGTVRLLDAVVVHASVDGTVTISELEDEEGRPMRRSTVRSWS